MPGGKPNILAIEAAPAYNPTNMVAANPLDFGAPPAASTAPSSLYKPTTIGESFSKIGEGLGMGDKPASFETFKQGAGELFSPTGPSTEQINARAAELVKQSAAGGMPLPVTTAIKQATSELAPGILRTYAPAAVAGLGAMAAFGGFDTKPVEGGDITKSLMKPVTQRIAEAGTQRQMYMQGLPEAMSSRIRAHSASRSFLSAVTRLQGLEARQPSRTFFFERREGASEPVQSTP